MPTLEYIWKPAREGDFTHGRGGSKVEAIILHSSCGHEAGDLLTLTGHDPGHLVSAHWYITKDGRIFHLVQNADTAYHAGVVTDPKYNNAHTIGIETEHLDGEEGWEDAQVQAAARLIVALRQQAGRELPVKSHAEVASPKGRKVDPVDFPWQKLHDYAVESANQSWIFRQI